MRSLNDKRVISQEMIRESCRDATLAFLQESDLADQVQQISIVPLNLNRVGDVFPAALRRSLGIAIRIWHSGAKRFPYPVRLRRGRLILEDLSKAWSVFFQTPYLLSVGYKVLVVMLEGDDSPIRGLPIRDRRTNGLSPYFRQPQIEQVMA